MKFDPGILRNYDIRGEYGKDFDDEFAERLGASLVLHTKAKRLIVARDMRPSSEKIAAAVMKGITSAGCDVIDIGTASTPFCYYVVTSKDAPAGIMVTASHMGPRFNGFKIALQNGTVLGKDSGLLPLIALVKQDKFTQADKGNVEQMDFVGIHAEDMIRFSGLLPGQISFRVALDVEPMILTEVDSAFKMLDIQRVAIGEPYDIAFKCDADGDRLSLFNKNGEEIRPDLYTGMIAGYFAQKKTTEHPLQFINDLRASRGVREYLAHFPVRFISSKIGHTYIKLAMKKHDADFCGEFSGHMMFKVTRYAESTLLAILIIIKIIAESGMSIDQIIAPLDTWAHSGERNTPIDGWPSSVPVVLSRVKQRFKDGVIDEIDGLKVDYPDWWFLIRASANDPVIRLIVEAKTKEMMEAKVAELQKLME